MKACFRISWVLISAIWLSAAISARAQVPDSTEAKPGATDESAALALKLQNPISSLISVPFQSNHDYGIGLNRGYKGILNIQPVIPIPLSPKWNMIVRVIFPVIEQNNIIGNTEQKGIGDIVNSFFFSPSAPGKLGIIWGVGPVFLIPTASEELLGTEKFGLGPTFVVLKQSGPWTAGILANQIWSVAGPSNREDVNALYFQPFLAHTSKSAFTVNLSGENTYNWVPGEINGAVILGISQVIKLRQQAISLGINGKTFYGPEGAPDWGWRFVLTFLFPAGAQK
jgi:hypothetical protein